MKNRVINLIVLSLMISLLSCRNNHYEIRGRLEKMDINILRLEKDLFTLVPLEPEITKDSLTLRYGDFLQLFAYVIDAGDLSDSLAMEKITGFATNRRNYEVYQMVKEKYPDMNLYEDAFGDVWARYNYYFPDSVIPAMYTFTSDFTNSVIVGDSVLGIGLDRYLGEDTRYYTELGIYNYIRKKMAPERIVPDAIYAWAKASYPLAGQENTANLIQTMLHEGKLYYYTRCMLFDLPDSLIFGFSAPQMNFCRNNEYRMWEYLIEHDMLFSTDLMLIRKLTGEAPFTSYFTSESPGRAAVWIGFRIIESYMKNNPEVDLPDLMNMDEYNEILNEAKYDPAR